MIDLDSLKKNISNLLRDPAVWAKFSANTAGAIAVAKSWKVTLTDGQAQILIAVLGRLHAEMNDAIIDFLNQATAANGVRGGGGGPKQWAYELRLPHGSLVEAGRVLDELSAG